MHKILFAAVAVLPLVLGATVASADSIKDAFGASMYQPQKSLPNALENRASGFTGRGLVEGRSAFVDPEAFYDAFANVQPATPSRPAPLVGRDWRAGDNF